MLYSSILKCGSLVFAAYLTEASAPLIRIEFWGEEMLSEEQKKIVFHPSGHACVAAVPGSGKTFTLIERIAHLLDRGVAARAIQVLCYNRSAAEDFRYRLAKRCPGYGERIDVATFHALGHRWLRTLSRARKAPAPRLCTEEQRRRYRRRALASAERKRSTIHNFVPQPDESVEKRFEEFCTLVNAADNVDEQLQFLAHEDRFPPHFAKAYSQQRHLMRLDGLMDFDQLCRLPIDLLDQKPGLRDLLGAPPTHILADEMQDASPVQIRMIRHFMGPGTELMMVGDDDQSIYQWRGATPEFLIAGAKRIWPELTHYQLTLTWRFGDAIARMANRVIRANRHRINKVCRPAGVTTDGVISVHQSPLEHHGQAVCDCAQRWIDDGRHPGEMAVLVRNHDQAALVEAEMQQRQIPYRVRGGHSWLQRREIRSVIGPLLGTLPANDGLHAESGVIESVWFDTLRRHARALPHEYALMLAGEMAAQPAKQADALKHFLTQATELSDDAVSQLTRFAQLLRAVAPIPPQAPADAVIDGFELLDANLRSSLLDRSRVASGLAEVLHDRAEQSTIADLLQSAIHVALPPTSNLGEVQILSLHRSKGLEWPAVVMPGLLGSLFPGEGVHTDITEQTLEAERRLFFVGLTRARERICLITPEDPAIDEALNGRLTKIPTASPTTRYVFEALRTGEPAGEVA